MADRGSQNRSNMSRPLSSSGRKSATNVRNNISRPNTTNDLLSREEEYKRLNEELEAKTANLVKEAEEVLKEQESLLSKPSLLDTINTDDFLNDYEEEEKKLSARATNSRTGSAQGEQSTRSRPPSSKLKKSAKSKARNTKSNLNEDVATVDDAFLTEFKEFSLHKTISNIEGQMEQGELEEDEDDDVLPQAAADMGAEAQIRFLKAKLRVMQEELDRLAQECNKKEEENNALLQRVKELDDDRNRLQRTNSTQQTQIDKYKRLADDAKGKSDSLENQLTGLRKELDSLKRSQKQQSTTQSATEVRLNRALEEVEKYKSELHRAKSASKDTKDAEKKRIDQLLAENKRLEKQKNELMTGFKKQLKLIDILKRQKMHIEAAKMLQFSEDEFVKALEWGN
ncbi:testis-expressed protein 9 isoform X2 [Lingula anatina]|uniref:Testis-expressed protein 9 isoform X2 n=1 Tax=Lingula anatina TaxID=7574 RepID=A0A1S3HL14_LINAN|nr:testis-expressed protein 9 isoform X2 [Lingula anatina]|eukprot:XP_013385699.1 testis-expressed protein 9 isoform X2 [Lingula anatina]